MNTINRILLVIVIILAIGTAILWFKPDLLTSLSMLNPFGSSGETTIPMMAVNSPTIQSSPNSSTTSLTASKSVFDIADNDNNAIQKEEEREEVLSPFEKEIRQRTESYRTKIYSYEPYQPPVLRNPFQRIVSSVYLEEEEGEIADTLSTEDAIRRFVQPELPPGSKFTGLISAGEEKLAILEIDKETYIVKEGDLILDKFLIKSISDEKVVIDINGYEILLILGGGESTNE